MKVFYTPAIDGIYRPLLQKRVQDQPDNKVYEIVEQYLGQDGLDSLDRDGSVKLLDRLPDSLEVKGYWTYQQDDL